MALEKFSAEFPNKSQTGSDKVLQKIDMESVAVGGGR